MTPKFSVGQRVEKFLHIYGEPNLRAVEEE